MSNKDLFSFYETIKKGKDNWSYEDLELAIQTLENAREGLREREQKRLLQKQVKQRRKKTEKIREKTIRLSAKTRRIAPEAYREREDITRLVIEEGVSEIGKGAFAGCKNLKEIVFPSNRILLRRECFSDCTALQKIYIPDVANIDPFAFRNCTSLKSVSLPGTISNIFSGAFKNCYSLKNVMFREDHPSYFRWSSISSAAFENCFSLESIRLPRGCGVSTKAFCNCNNLKTVYMPTLWKFSKKFEKCGAEVIFL